MGIAGIHLTFGAKHHASSCRQANGEVGVHAQGGGSIGRAAVSKTAGCRFESCPPCECRATGIHIKPKGNTVTDEITPATAADRGERKKSIFGRIAQFMREVVIELRKVVTPTRKELVTYTSVVLVFVIIMMTLISGLDVVIGTLTGFVFGNGTLPWSN